MVDRFIYGARYGCIFSVAVALLSGCGGDDKISSPTEKSASPASPASSPAALSDQRYADPNTYSSNPNDSLPSNSAFDQAAVTHHTITLNGKAMNYTATAGHLTAVAPNADKSKPADNEVSFFYVC